MVNDSEKIEKEILRDLSLTKSLEELQKIRVSELGKKGRITLLMKELSGLEPQVRKLRGEALNNLRTKIDNCFDQREEQIQDTYIASRIEKEKLDVSLSSRPSSNSDKGKIHPISRTMDEIISIFSIYGFTVETGPEIESDYNNFTALNIPQDHPARQDHDTFYISKFKNRERKLLRTHTSPVQIRTMNNKKPPIRIIVPGRTYRSDSDSTHTPMFHQVEGLLIDESSTMAHLKGCLIDFLKEFFEIDNLQYRFRPSYFPFTEPSAEMDVAFTKINDVLKIGKGNQWLEILGCGMVNPHVLDNCNINSKKYQGFAFGMGIERLSMLKYGITDMRGFFDSDFRWLNHYGFNPFDLSTSTGI